MTPHMQLGGTPSTNAKGSSADLNGDLTRLTGNARESSFRDKVDSTPRKLGDTRQGNISVEIWKRAFTDALKRLCPLQGEGLECGCLPALNRMVSWIPALSALSFELLFVIEKDKLQISFHTRDHEHASGGYNGEFQVIIWISTYLVLYAVKVMLLLAFLSNAVCYPEIDKECALYPVLVASC